MKRTSQKLAYKDAKHAPTLGNLHFLLPLSGKQSPFTMSLRYLLAHHRIRHAFPVSSLSSNVFLFFFLIKNLKATNRNSPVGAPLFYSIVANAATVHPQTQARACGSLILLYLFVYLFIFGCRWILLTKWPGEWEKKEGESYSWKRARRWGYLLKREGEMPSFLALFQAQCPLSNPSHMSVLNYPITTTLNRCLHITRPNYPPLFLRHCGMPAQLPDLLHPAFSHAGSPTCTSSPTCMTHTFPREISLSHSLSLQEMSKSLLWVPNVFDAELCRGFCQYVILVSWGQELQYLPHLTCLTPSPGTQHELQTPGLASQSE